jgi:hypothetical protein
MTIRMKALKAFPFAGRRLQAGQEFEARGQSEARVFAAIRCAEYVNAVAAAPAGGTYNTRAMTAAAPAAVAAVIVQVDGADVDLAPMGVEALHTLAKRLNVKVHHLAGAAKVRAAILEAQGSAK